jgi:hypothetical protein
VESSATSAQDEATAREALARALLQLADARARLALSRGEDVATAALLVKRAEDETRQARHALDALPRLDRGP